MIVKRAEALGCTLAELPLAELQAMEPAITAAVYDVLDAGRSVASRTSFGGTAPERVRAAARRRARGFWNDAGRPSPRPSPRKLATGGGIPPPRCGEREGPASAGG